MKVGVLITSSAMAMTIAVFVVGCNSNPSAEEPTAATPAPSNDTSERDNAMAQLSPEDRGLAEAQNICPVSKAPLGSMGEPIKVTVDGRSIFVCCPGCVDELKANFAKYAEELDAKY
jgi:hypothetical protein